MPPKKPAPGATDPAPVTSFSLREEETDDGWVLLGGGGGGGRPPRPPPRRGTSRPSAGGERPPLDPTPDDLVGRYLRARRALRCGELPPQIHDADVYGAHPAFLANVHPPANGGGDRLEWFFFVCRGRGLGGKRKAGRGAYRLVGETNDSRGGGGGGAWYCHSFRYHEDAAEASASKETEWRMDEYGDRDDDDDSSGAGAGAAFDMVVCKVYPARGGALHERLVQQHSTSTSTTPAAGVKKPQVLVQLYLASRSVGDPLRCRMHHATDVCAAHPAVLTGVLPAANDRFEWFFAARRPRTTEHGGGDDGIIAARPRRAGPGQYVPAARHYWGVRDGEGRDVGYRRVFLYREDDEAARRLSRTEWWMEEYGFGPDFPFDDENGNDEELVVCKVYLRMARR